MHMCTPQVEAARRLQNAKRGGTPLGGSKRRRLAEESEGDEEEAMEEEEAEAPKPAGVRVKRGVLIDSDDDD